MKIAHSTSRASLSALILIGGLVAGHTAQAAPTPACQTDEVTFGIGGATPANADACIGWDGAIGANPTDETAWVDAAWTGAFGGGDFDFVTKWDSDDGDGNGSFGGVDFTLKAEANSTGNYILEWTDNGSAVLPETFDLVFVAKASTGHGGFLFDDITLMDSPATGGGTFSIGFLNNGGNAPGLSHLSMLVRQADTPDEPGNPPTSVSETSTLALLFVGMSMMVRRRRRASL